MGGRDFLWVDRWLIGVMGGVLGVFLVVPLLALVLTMEGGDFWGGLSHPLVWPALRLSLWTTLLSLGIVVVFGTPLGWILARMRGRLGGVIETVVQMPMVVPPAVAGVLLLLAFGRRGWLIGWGLSEDYVVAFTTWGVVVAEVFVSAPFYVQAAVGAFRRVDERLIVVARTLGARPWRVFWGVGLPLAAHGLVAGAAMSWARALGEFGATLMFAGNLQGETQTLPLAIYTALESDLRAAQALSIVLVVVAFALLLFVRALTRKATDAI
jgi:molybdate transport system permease protein